MRKAMPGRPRTKYKQICELTERIRIFGVDFFAAMPVRCRDGRVRANDRMGYAWVATWEAARKFYGELLDLKGLLAERVEQADANAES
jgi:hypothetical protein